MLSSPTLPQQRVPRPRLVDELAAAKVGLIEAGAGAPALLDLGFDCAPRAGTQQTAGGDLAR